jgi:hypothetical protein
MKINDNGIEREMTEEEIANHSVIFAEIEANKKRETKEAVAKAKLRNEVLAKLGLTADEVAALLS